MLIPFILNNLDGGAPIPYQAAPPWRTFATVEATRRMFALPATAQLGRAALAAVGATRTFVVKP